MGGDRATAAPPGNTTSQGPAGFQILPRRWVVERTFAWIGKRRRCVRDYETRPEHHEAMAHLSMIMTMSRTGDWQLENQTAF